MVIIFLHYVTRGYEIGDFGYWNAGPDFAIFYDDIYEQAIVEVVPLGHADKGAETLADETGMVRLKLVEDAGRARETISRKPMLWTASILTLPG